MSINTEKILDEVDKIGAYIAEKLEVPAEIAMDIIMRQVYFKGVMALFWVVLGSATLFFFTKWFSKKRKSKEYIESYNGKAKDEGGTVVMTWVAYLLSLLFSLTCIFANIENLIHTLINPKWVAVEIIMELIK